MSMVDRQPIAAVKTLEALGYTFDGIKRMPPMGHPLWAEADALYVLLVDRAHNVGLVGDKRVSSHQAGPQGLRGTALAQWEGA
jgi:hypothetical protein